MAWVQRITDSHNSANPRRKNLDFRGFFASRFLISKGWNAQAHGELPRNPESTTLNSADPSCANRPNFKKEARREGSGPPEGPPEESPISGSIRQSSSSGRGAVTFDRPPYGPSKQLSVFYMSNMFFGISMQSLSVLKFTRVPAILH